MRVFHPPKKAIECALDKAKADGVVHPDAEFNYKAEDGLRREVCFRDADFQYRLERTPHEKETVDAALQMLVELKVVPAEASYDVRAFEKLRARVKEMFTGSWTTITPVMEHLMYMLTAVKRPRRLVELGSFWGNSLAWFAGPCIGPFREFEAEKVYGVDIDVKMTEQARKNFDKLGHCESLELVGEDAGVVLERIEGPIDFLYLEAKDEDNKSGYLEFLKQAYDKLPKGAWVIAHDSTAYDHQKDLEGYLAWVRDPHNFVESISFDVDRFGMELSIK